MALDGEEVGPAKQKRQCFCCSWHICKIFPCPCPTFGSNRIWYWEMTNNECCATVTTATYTASTSASSTRTKTTAVVSKTLAPSSSTKSKKQLFNRSYKIIKNFLAYVFCLNTLFAQWKRGRKIWQSRTIKNIQEKFFCMGNKKNFLKLFISLFIA